MNPLKKTRNNLLRLASRVRYAASKPKERYLHERVPYFCQWESRELAAKILDGIMPAEADPRWKDFGAGSPEEYALWSWNVCGMTCLKMILAGSRGIRVPLMDLARKCTGYGGYVVRGAVIDGLYYKPFARFAAKEYGLNVTVKPVMTQEDIIGALSRGLFVMASVSPEIRKPEVVPAYRGGHLILMLGYDLKERVFYLNNPSGNTPQTQEYAVVRFDDFGKFFDSKGMLIGGFSSRA